VYLSVGQWARSLMQVETLDLKTVRMMEEEQELMGAVDAYKPGVGQASVVATRLEEQTKS
jgi:hypothetical protein